MARSDAAVSEVVARIEGLDVDVHAFVPEEGRLDRIARDGLMDGPLQRMPVGVKDLYRVDDLPTRAGSRLPPELFAGRESDVVAKLRAAGAMIVGKTAMDEFAYCEPPETKNPRDLRRTPGGSSGGSAAAVAAGMCPLAVGSQTLQSVIVPAAYCGVLGYKPTYQRAPFDGVPLSPSFDTVGFLAESSAVLTLAAHQLIPHWRAAHSVQQPVIGVAPPWGKRQLHAEGWSAFDTHVALLRAAGFEIRESELPWNRDLEHWAVLIGDLVHGEMARAHSPWYQAHKSLYRSRTRAAVERGLGVSDDRLVECRLARDVLIAELNPATQDAGIDCWICPATGSIATLGYEKTGDSWLTSFWSYAGWPQLTLPVFDGADGLPHGLQCIGQAGCDEHLLVWTEMIAAVFSC